MSENSGMVAMQIYVSGDIKEKLRKEYGEGRVSANIERILRAHLANPAEEKKIRLRELQKEIRRFNADFMCAGELVFSEADDKRALVASDEKQGVL